VGIAKDYRVKDTFTRGIELIGRQTLFAEGCRGSCSEQVIERFNLRSAGGDKNVQTYGLGLKEVWQLPPDRLATQFKSGLVQHTLGWPLQRSLTSDLFGGTFLYHMEPDLVLVGMVVGLDYKNPYLNPYKEFQRWKHHPAVAKHLEGGECISYGARCLNEGGYHSIPKLTFPGGALIGCSAGFLNSVKIKGSHTAMKSGMLAAEVLHSALINEEGNDSVAVSGEDFFSKTRPTIEIQPYEKALYSSWVGEELKQVRNTHASFHSFGGLLFGLLHTAFSCFISKGKEPWTLRNTKPDSEKTELAEKHTTIEYPKSDGVLSFDLLTNLQRSGTSHEHDQPAHLKVKENLKDVPSEISIKQFAGPEQRFCPAGVYEYTEADVVTGKQELVINAQNCVHCKYVDFSITCR